MHERLLAVGACLSVLAVTHGPGRRVGASGGVGAYSFAGCNASEQDARFGEGQVWYYDQPERGTSVALEGSLVRARETTVAQPPPPASSTIRWGGTVAARIGYQWPAVGVEGGLALGPMRVGGDRTGILPSLRLRLGPPPIVYFFATLAAEETRGASRIAGIGLGHAGRHVRAAVGYGASQGNDNAPFADLALRLGNVWAGIGGQWLDRRTYSGLINVGLQLPD